jgi:hypothetical protein
VLFVVQCLYTFCSIAVVNKVQRVVDEPELLAPLTLFSTFFLSLVGSNESTVEIDKKSLQNVRKQREMISASSVIFRFLV